MSVICRPSLIPVRRALLPSLLAFLSTGAAADAQLLQAQERVAAALEAGQWAYYRMDTRAYHTWLTMNLTTTRGELDLYLRRGELPDAQTYDCAPLLSGRVKETCKVANTQADGWYIGVHAREAGKYVLRGAPSGNALVDMSSGVPEMGEVGEGSWRHYQLQAGAGDERLAIVLDELAADLDLYVNRGRKPSLSRYDCRPWLGGVAQERCDLSTTEGDTWFISVYGFQAGGYRLSATLSGNPAPPPAPETGSRLIHLDQFGYLPEGPKVAVLADPQQGFNASESYTPGTAFEVRRVADDAVVANVVPQQWKNGQTHGQSGDRAWWLDFSVVTAPGDYYLYDTATQSRSHPFQVHPHVYSQVLEQAVRSFFYQRINHAKDAPQADPRWADDASHGGPGQDFDARLMNPDDPGSSDPATGRDLSGGWYDAGDYNKYVNYADDALHDLLLAYEERPGVWRDDSAIPESGNGVPDLLDEVRWELDWLLRMQTADGSVLHKVASINWDGGSPPSSDVVPRRYAPATASATISAAGVYAHAARVFRGLSGASEQAYAERLATAALAAWNWLEANPERIPSAFDNRGFVNAAAEDSPEEQAANRVLAGVYLLALTGEARFGDYVRDRAASDTLLLREGYLMNDGVETEVTDALLYYGALPAADPQLAADIRSAYHGAMNMPKAWVPFSPLRRFREGEDPYRAYLDDHHWGSNRSKAKSGNMLTSAVDYGVAEAADEADYRAAAAGYLHYLHGTNPHGMVYLSNMAEYGAERSVPEFYHLWFSDGSPLWDSVEGSFYGPAPGFLVGGPNQFYSRGGVYIDGIQDSDHLLKSQPAMKRYWSWNTPNDLSYEISENSITYQAPYVRLLSKFLD